MPCLRHDGSFDAGQLTCKTKPNYQTMKMLQIALAALAFAALPTFSFAAEGHTDLPQCKACCKTPDGCKACCKDKGKNCLTECCKAKKK